MIIILSIVILVITVAAQRYYFGRWELIDQKGKRVIRGSYWRCYDAQMNHEDRVANWEIRKIK